MQRLFDEVKRLSGNGYFRAGGTAFVGLLSAFKFIQFLDTVYPIRDWLFAKLAIIWGWDAFLSLAFVSAGHALLVRFFKPRDDSGIELLSLSAGLGATLFVMGMYAGGFLHLYGPVFAVALPGAMIAFGLPDGATALLSAQRTRVRARSFSALEIAATAFGTLCVGILYLGCLPPEAVNYDASWNHLVIAQDYAREGRIVPFLADWVKNVPHLGSIVNTWAFLVPGLDMPALRWMMGLHNEFTFFLWTLVGVAAVVRWLTQGADVRGTWAAFFLFPAIFVYDSNMGAAADHFLAFFIPPLFLAVARALHCLSWRDCILAGVLAAAAILTKLHASYVLGPIALAFFARFLFFSIQRLRGRSQVPSLKKTLTGLVSLALSGLVAASPHFLKNWVFYKNPLYPLAQRQFPASTPGIPDAGTQLDYLFADWRYHVPTALGERITAAFKVVFHYSFEPHYSFIGSRPYSGSLFTLGLLFLPFLPRSRRLWFGAFVGCGALFCWGLTFWVDRNLQTFMPLLVAVTCAILVRAWELGWLARVGVAALVCTQLVWGADLYFSGSDRISAGISLIRSGFDGRAKQRFGSVRSEYVQLGNALPKDATVILHNGHVMLGIDRRVFHDLIGFQGLIDYRTFKTPRDVFERFRQVGATHIVFMASSGVGASKQEDILFHDLVSRYGGPIQSFGDLRMVALDQATLPAPRAPFTVLSVGVPGYADGVYPIEALSVCEQMPPNMQHFPSPIRTMTDRDASAAFANTVDVVMLGSSANIPRDATQILETTMKRVVGYPEFSVYTRE